VAQLADAGQRLFHSGIAANREFAVLGNADFDVVALF